ncbi:hypothetical protein Pla100_56550 [Neorhodopirellula pilleata]|uniref:DUF4177 domain-containing protein n=1 Tax=Neorhodopirellula pilleata TaxID=2714738 RepID=A0A5C5ZQ16_9BACT|nr:hypothetical protein Pla100_56550 [Neorhodopirellula pilleata]
MTITKAMGIFLVGSVLLHFTVIINADWLQAQDANRAATTRWEYKIVDHLSGTSQIQKALETAPDEGWEIVGTVSETANVGSFRVRKGDSSGSLSVRTHVSLICKRPKP